MPSGGARVRSGPAPDPNALSRERDKAEWTTLPAEGRLGDPPKWPLSKPTARERAMWVDLWRRPQAVKWEELDLVDEVALYVRRFRLAERPNAPANTFAPCKQLADSLGLTIPGLARNRWKIGQARQSDTTTTEPAVPFRPRVVANAVEGA